MCRRSMDNAHGPVGLWITLVQITNQAIRNGQISQHTAYNLHALLLGV